MFRKSSVLFLSAVLLLALLSCLSLYISGCGSGALAPEEPSSQWIQTRSPGIDANFNSSFGLLTIIFGKKMDRNYSSFATGEGHTAGDIMGIISGTFWTTVEGKDCFNAPVSGSIDIGTVVLVPETGGFRAANGDQLPGSTILWKFNYNYDPLISFSISGTITLATGTGTTFAIAYDHDPSKGEMLGIHGMGIADGSGNYTISGLGSGEYWVAGFTDNWPDMQYTAGEPWRKFGAVTVGPSRTGKDFPLNVDPLSIISSSRSPALDATNVPATDQTYSITFNNAIDPSSFDPAAFAFDPSHTAGFPSAESPQLSGDMRTISVVIDHWIGATGDQVNIVASEDAKIADINGRELTFPETFWRCTLRSNSISGTITGGTNEVVKMMLSTSNIFDDIFASKEVTLTGGSTTFAFSLLPNGTYYLGAWSSRTGGTDIEPNDLLGMYSQPFGLPAGITINNSSQTNRNFPLSCYTGRGSPLITHYVTGNITTNTDESYYIGIAITTDESIFTSPTPLIYGFYYLPPPSPSQTYYFSGLTNDHYYVVAVQKAPGNPNPWPEDGDYAGSAEVIVSGGNKTGIDIDLWRVVIP